MNPNSDDFWFLPLGGCGEIGMNMSLYGHNDQWLMVDCGITFRDPDGTNDSGYHVQMANPEFAVNRRDQLQGLLLTHAHEDHIGAVPHLWPQLRCPIYTNTFTAEMLRRKLVEHGLEQTVPIHIIEAGTRHDIGVFDVEWVAHTHSIPDPCGLVIRTPVGSVFHTADWKLDDDPLVGHHYDQAHYEAIGQSGIDVMVCDSTCANLPGSSQSEGQLYRGLLELVEQARGRVVVGCFGSNIARLSTLAYVAEDTGRHLGLLGRSLINTVSAARSVGLWRHRASVDAHHLGYLPRESVLLVATGSQAEPRAALSRLSTDSLHAMALEPEDTVIFSARAIPGNEEGIEQMIARLRNMGVKVIQPEDCARPIHASGHPGQDDLSRLYDWIKPDVLIPVHGEDEHLEAHVKLAKSKGISRQLNGRNGDLFILAPNKALRRGVVEPSRQGVGKKALELIN